MVDSWKDKVFLSIVYASLIIVFLFCILPMLYVVSTSFTSYSEVIRRGIVLIPKKIDISAYQYILKDSAIPKAFAISVFITIVGTAVSLLGTVLTAYPLSREELPGRKAIMLLITFTMFFSGGMIPLYFTVKTFGMINSVWSMILPFALSPFNIIIMRTFFSNIEKSLIESAYMDGAGEFKILRSIVFPLSTPVLATIALFYGVGLWNTYTNAIWFITDPKLYPLQVVVKTLVDSSTMQDMANPERVQFSMGIKMAAIVISAIPIIVVYPFVQNYFVKGTMLGAVKG